MIKRFTLHRRIDGLVNTFERHGSDRFKRTDGDYWIINHHRYGWVAWDEATQAVMGRPWNVDKEDQGNVPPEGEWVSKKADRSYVYDLVHS